MTQVIQLKRSAVQSKVPATTDLQLGELGINTYDGKLFLKKNVGGTESVIDLASFNNLTALPTTLSGYGITNGQVLSTDLTAIAALVGTTGFLKKTAAGAWSLDTSVYLTGNQSIAVSGDASGTGATAITLTLAASGVTAGSYGGTTAIPVITIDAKGRVTSASTAAISTVTTLTGDVTGTGSGTFTTTLAASGVTAGTYTALTVNSKGLVIAATSPNTLSGLGITDSMTATAINTATTTAIGVETSRATAAEALLAPKASPTFTGTVNGITSSMVGAQPLSAELTGVAGIAATLGLVKKTAAGTYALDTNVYLTSNQSISVTGDATGSGTSAITLTLANSGVTAGTYTALTVNSKGLVIAATSPNTLSGHGITDSMTATAINTAISTAVSTETTRATTAEGLAELSSHKGAASGYCPLDASTKISTAYLPDSVLGALEFQGTWNANTNSPTIPTAAPANKGFYYVANTSGATSVSGTTNWIVGDWLVSNGTIWDKVNNTDAVSSVNGRLGAITLTSTDVGLGNVNNTSDVNKPVSTATTTAIGVETSRATAAEGLLAPKASPTFTGTVSGITSSMVGAQPLSAELTGVAGIAATLGLVKKTAVGTYALDTNVYLTSNQSIAVTGDATGSGTSAITLTLANSGVTAGTYTALTVNSKGLVIAATNPNTLSGHGITDSMTATAINTAISTAVSTETSRATAAEGLLAPKASPTFTGTVSGITSSMVGAQPLSADLTGIAGIAATLGLVKKTAAGTYALDTNVYLTSNQSIAVSGDATGSGTSAITLTLANSGVTAATVNNSATAITPITVNAKGLITTTGAAVTITPAFSSIIGKPTTVAGYGITDAVSNSVANTTIPLVNGNVSSATLVTSTTTAGQVLDTNAIATFRSVKYFIQVTSGTSYQVSEINIMHDGTLAYINEYSTMFTAASLATFDAAISGGNLQLIVTPVSAITTFKLVRTAINI